MTQSLLVLFFDHNTQDPSLKLFDIECTSIKLSINQSINQSQSIKSFKSLISQRVGLMSDKSSLKMPYPLKMILRVCIITPFTQLLQTRVCFTNAGMFYQRGYKHLRRGNTQGKKTCNSRISIVPISNNTFQALCKRAFLRNNGASKQ